MYSLVLMTAMTASAPEAPKCFYLFQGFFNRPVAAACYGCAGCNGCAGVSRGCWGSCYGGGGCQGMTNGCHGGGGCAGMRYAYGSAYGGTYAVFPPTGSRPVYIGSEGIWAGTWSYSGIYPGQGPTSIPGSIGRTKMADPPENSARIIIDVPVNARVFIDGQLMDGTTTERFFYTPPLVQGQSYFYDVRIETVKDGKTDVREKKVIVQAGAMVKETFKQIGPSTSLASTNK